MKRPQTNEPKVSLSSLSGIISIFPSEQIRPIIPQGASNNPTSIVQISFTKFILQGTKRPLDFFSGLVYLSNSDDYFASSEIGFLLMKIKI